jgi:hypothetical protein
MEESNMNDSGVSSMLGDISVTYGDAKTQNYTANWEDTVYDNQVVTLQAKSTKKKAKPKQEITNYYYKYAENQIIADFQDYIDKTYGEHYKTEEHNVECFDAWIALGNSTDTFRNTALKYLWRYGKKNGNNKADLMKALHYTLMCLYVDHYKDEK